ncbi:MAG: NADH-quinone oxidoreductase subunit C [Thiohalomonadaceae bacterium]
MSEFYTKLARHLEERFRGIVASVKLELGEVTIEVPREHLLSVCRALRDEDAFRFEQLIDACGIDYLEYGEGRWQGPRFGVVYHLLSVAHNQRLRVRTFATGEVPVVDSVVEIWNSANWYEREAFDLFGIVFEGHPDLRRILTDYGFIGHPFRKDFPLSGQGDMRFDPEKQRVFYVRGSIEPRSLVPRVSRRDHRYEVGEGDERCA